MLQKVNGLHRAFNLINWEFQIDEGQYQLYSKQIEGYLTGNSHFSTHWHQAYIQHRSNQWRDRQVRTQEIYISVTNDESYRIGFNADQQRLVKLVGSAEPLLPQRLQPDHLQIWFNKQSMFMKIKSILLVTGMAMSTAWMVEGKIGGAELGRAILMLVPSADSRIGENNLKTGGAELGRAI